VVAIRGWNDGGAIMLSNVVEFLFLKGISIYSWIGTLSPEFPIAASLSTRNRTTIISAMLASTYALVQALSALLLEILNLNLLNPELIEMPLT